MNEHVFINCPFDEEYTDCFEAILFTLTYAGYSARSALEERDSGDIRFEKICQLIETCDTTLHDLSRVEASKSGLPRFNMPLELGVALGARRFGPETQKKKRLLIMVGEPFEMPKYMSNLAGNDPQAHGGKPTEVIRIVRDFLQTAPSGLVLPGATDFNDLFMDFRRVRPELAKIAKFTVDEINPLWNFLNFMSVLRAFVDSKRIVPPPREEKSQSTKRKSRS